MRERLNSNPVAQIAVIGVLLVATGFFVLSSMGGGGESESSSTTTSSASVTTPAGEVSVTASVTTPSGASAAPASVASAPEVPAPPLPHRVTAAFDANRTVVLLIVKKGGYEDALLAHVVRHVRSMPDVSTFVIRADKIARYAAITQGVRVNRVPALVVLKPKDLDHGVPVASVSYGVQSIESAEQAVRDARYKGRTLNYYP